MLDAKTKYYIKPTGRFVIGGPMGDTGLTGRKIIVDTYGGMARHGGGAFSGKDPTKVDRSAAYMARYIAKNVVAAGLADRFEIQVSYAIGVARPSRYRCRDLRHGQGIAMQEIVELIHEHFDLRPAAIIQTCELRRPIYKPTAAYGALRPHRHRRALGAPRQGGRPARGGWRGGGPKLIARPHTYTAHAHDGPTPPSCEEWGRGVVYSGSQR